MSQSRSADEIKRELFANTPEKLHPLIEELDGKRRYAWQQFFKVQQRLEMLLKR